MVTKKAETKTEKIEREYTIPLRKKYQHVARYKKTPKAIKTIKEFLVKHMKIYDKDLNKIKLDRYVNEYIWQRGIKNPPHKIKVKVIKKGDDVKVELVDYSNKFKFKKAREEKQETEAKQAVEKKKTLMQKVKEGKTEKSETKPEDQDKDGVKDKVEETEKQKAGAESAKQQAKSQAKQMKHTSGGKTKQPKRPQRKSLAK